MWQKFLKKNKEKLGLTKLYIADINSILEKGNNFRYIEEIKEKTESSTSFRLWH